VNGRGALRFARYAFPPNQLGYCGPADSGSLLEHIMTGTSDAELRQLATGFAGAWPYLELIAAAAGRDDPLDPDVVEAYWLGNGLLDAVPVSMMGNSLDDRFRRRAGAGWSSLAEAIPAGAVPHHSFHVFGVYPWVGLLRAGEFDEPLRILDRCRIRTGTVQAIEGSSIAVRSRPLTWDGYRLDVGSPTIELVHIADDGSILSVGATVTMHWDWICESVSPAVAMRVEAVTRSQMDLVNHLSLPGPAALLT
jgi:Family of unknown function (DUF6390)